MGNCCPDHVTDGTINDPSIPSAQCHFLNEILNEQRLNSKRKMSFYSDYAYRVIDFCPEENVAKKLFRQCKRPSRYFDYAPVSSSDGNMLFKNKYCAECHGYVDVVPWKLYLVDECAKLDSQFFQTASERESFIYSNCLLYSTPPNKHFSQKVLCPTLFFDNYVSECNRTGMLESFDAHIKEMCENPTERVNSIYTAGKEAFKNVFCFLCNKNETHEDMCPIIDDGNLAFSYMPQFKILINTKQWEKITDDSKTRCSTTEVYDHYLVSDFCERWKQN